MNASKKLQANPEKKSANVQRSSSYRLALRRSAPPPPETEDLLTKSDEHKEHKSSPETEVKSVVTTQPAVNSEKKISIDDSYAAQTEPMITDHKMNGEKDVKNIDFVSDSEVEGQNVCTKFCCHRLCCNYCECCPNCCSFQMKRLESLLIQMTECGLNCLRVFT